MPGAARAPDLLGARPMPRVWHACADSCRCVLAGVLSVVDITIGALVFLSFSGRRPAGPCRCSTHPPVPPHASNAGGAQAACAVNPCVRSICYAVHAPRVNADRRSCIRAPAGPQICLAATVAAGSGHGRARRARRRRRRRSGGRVAPFVCMCMCGAWATMAGAGAGPGRPADAETARGSRPARRRAHRGRATGGRGRLWRPVMAVAWPR